MTFSPARLRPLRRAVVLMILMALMLPGSPARAYFDEGPFLWNGETYCSSSGGSSDLGRVGARRVQIGEQGRSGVNYFTIRIRLEHLDAEAGRWRLQESVDHRSPKFANDANDYTYPGPSEFFAQRWSFTSAKEKQPYRVRVVYEWWDAKAGPDEKLFTRRVIDDACTGSAPVLD